MLELSKCEILESHQAEVNSAAVTSITEGQICVWSYVNGIAKVVPSGGTSGEKFAGIANSRFVTPTTGKFSEDIVVPASSPYTVTLSRTLASGAVPGAVILADDAARAPLVKHADTVNSGQFTISGQVITVDSSYAGRTIRVVYDIALSVNEAALLYGHDFSPVPASVDGIGVITAGLIYTTMYDPTVDWAAGQATIKTGADGKFVTSGNGMTLDAIVAEAPTPGQPFLGIRIKP